MDEECVFFAEVVPELSYCFEEGESFDVSDRSA